VTITFVPARDTTGTVTTSVVRKAFEQSFLWFELGYFSKIRDGGEARTRA
jgi:hypothetical protein